MTGKESDMDRFFPSRFLRAVNVDKPTEATIEGHDEETIQRSDGDETVPVVKLSGFEKPLVLNKTNFKAIADIAGSENMRDWPGTVVEIYTVYGEYFGKAQDAIRIRKPTGPVKRAAKEPESKSVVDKAFEQEKAENAKAFMPEGAK